MVERVKGKILKARHRFTKEADYFQRAARERTFEYLLAAFGFVAGLAWNDAVKALIEELFPLAKNTIVAKFLYAILVTLAVVWITVYLARIFREQKREEEKKGE